MKENGKGWKVHSRISGVWYVLGNCAEIFEVLKEFVCKMYGFKCASMNKVRDKMFTERLKQEKRPSELSLLPSCQSVAKYQMEWAIYVAKLWRSSNIPLIDAQQFTVWLGFWG